MTCLTAIFQDKLDKPVPECLLSGFYWSKGDGDSGIRRVKLQSDRHHQQTNTQLFTGRMILLSPNQQHQINERVNTVNTHITKGTFKLCKMCVT